MAKIIRGRLVEASAKPAEQDLFHGSFVVSGTPTAITDRKCSTIALFPNDQNQGTIYIGSITDVNGTTLTNDNGFPLPIGGIVFGANMSEAKVRIYALGTNPGDTIRFIGVY